MTIETSITDLTTSTNNLLIAVNASKTELDSTVASVQTIADNMATIYPSVLTNGVWARLPAIYKILLGGVGTVTLDTRDRAGNITTGVITYDTTLITEDYPYFDNTYQIRATFTGTATAELI